MSEEIRKLQDKATRSIDAATALLQKGDTDFAAARAYYAMFYLATALLLARGVKGLRKHTAVHTAFGEQYAKTGALDPKFHRWLLDAFDKRISGDYGVDIAITPEDTKVLIEQAQEFLWESQRHLIDAP